MKSFFEKVNDRFQKMTATGKLFRVNIATADIWDTYLGSFTNDAVWRDPESSVHNCNLCHNFIRRYGNVVALDDDLQITTMFDVSLDADSEYDSAAKALSALIKSSTIKSVFFESYQTLKELPYETCTKTASKFLLGIPVNHKTYTPEEVQQFGKVATGVVYTFHHFYVNLPSEFVIKTGESVAKIKGIYDTKKSLFQRTMEEISLDTFNLVKELIIQGSLLNAASYVNSLNHIIDLKINYNKVLASENMNPLKLDNWFWDITYSLSDGITHFKNTLLGVLCTELTEGEELNVACTNWNKRADPANYMKAVAPITNAQKKSAQHFIESNDYTESFDRRFAVLEDVKAGEIKHMNVSAEGIKSVSIFDNVKTKSSQHKRSKFENVEEVTIDTFMKDILPTCSQVELYLENKHLNNFVSLTTSKKADAKPLFMWDNPFSWTYKGGLAGKSLLKEAVKKHGGATEGVLRFSIMWGEDEIDDSDLDAHCKQPDGVELYYRHNKSSAGFLDIDVIHPQKHKVTKHQTEAVENIVFKDVENMPVGTYEFFVHQYTARRSRGFKAEIEVNGISYQYSYDSAIKNHYNILVAKVTLDIDGVLSIEHSLKATPLETVVYGLKTLQFHKVNLLCLSPNYWGDNAVGNKHYFFMLDKCKTDVSTRSFHNENLNSELKKHRKVLDILGEVTKISPIDNQLSGVGFNATVRDDVILKLSGNFKRVIKVKF